VLYDGRFKAFGEPWCRKLDTPVAAAIEALRAYAAASGRSPAGLLVGVDGWVEVRAAELGGDSQVGTLFDDASEAISALSYAAGSVLARMGGPLAEFVHGEMRIEYPWVPASLLRLFVVHLVAAMAEPHNPDAAVFGWEIQTPLDDDRNKVEGVLRISAGTQKAEAESRAAAFLAALYPPAPVPRARAKPLPKNDGRDLENDTRMYYRHEVLGQGPNAIAKDFGLVNYQTVQFAIKRVGSLLAVYVPYPAPGKDTKPNHKVQRRSPRR